jgi:Ribbon-helix-helix protein, copG family
MRRTNIYLDDEQLELLRGLGEQRGEPVAALVREAVDAWLAAQGARRIPEDERQRRFEALLRRRDRIWRELGVSEEEVEREVAEAIRQVRKARAARRS